MPPKAATTKSQLAAPGVWHDILDELRLLRQDLSLLLFQEDVDDYTNAEQIKQSYRKAIKKHRPSGQ